jgi:hypothetical protein
MVVKMVVRPIAKLSEYAAARMTWPIEHRCYDDGLPNILGSKRRQTLFLDAVFKAHLRPDQLSRRRGLMLPCGATG